MIVVDDNDNYSSNFIETAIIAITLEVITEICALTMPLTTTVFI